MFQNGIVSRNKNPPVVHHHLGTFYFPPNGMQVENDLQELRGDLKTWLMAQAEDDPFAYAVGSRQTRFGDDFDHERMARYDVRLSLLSITH